MNMTWLVPILLFFVSFNMLLNLFIWKQEGSHAGNVTFNLVPPCVKSYGQTGNRQTRITHFSPRGCLRSDATLWKHVKELLYDSLILISRSWMASRSCPRTSSSCSTLFCVFSLIYIHQGPCSLCGAALSLWPSLSFESHQNTQRGSISWGWIKAEVKQRVASTTYHWEKLFNSSVHRGKHISVSPPHTPGDHYLQAASVHVPPLNKVRGGVNRCDPSVLMGVPGMQAETWGLSWYDKRGRRIISPTWIDCRSVPAGWGGRQQM